jgi:hypothetical protein
VPVVTVAQRDSNGVYEIKGNSSYLDVNLRLLAFTVLLSIADLATDSTILGRIARKYWISYLLIV